MFASIEKSKLSNSVLLCMRDLEDKEYKTFHGHIAGDAERKRAHDAAWNADAEVPREFGLFRRFRIIGKQFNHQGTIGWEYETNDCMLILRHALRVAEKLGVTLHIEKAVLFTLIGQRKTSESFEIGNADQTQVLRNGEEATYVTRKLVAGEYFVLSNVVLPVLH
jgi:hypothetical protein